MDNFAIIYRILKYLEENMGEEWREIEKISYTTLGISFLRWESILCMMQEEGYIKGIVMEQTMSDDSPHIVIPIRPKITIRGLEYLSENGIMKKIANTLKNVKDSIPGL